MAPIPFPSLQEAWPFIRAIIKRRLRHGYKLTAPKTARPVMDGVGENTARPGEEAQQERRGAVIAHLVVHLTGPWMWPWITP